MQLVKNKSIIPEKVEQFFFGVLPSTPNAVKLKKPIVMQSGVVWSVLCRLQISKPCSKYF